MRSALPLVALLCIVLSGQTLAQGQGQGQGKGQGQGQKEGQGQNQGQGRGQGDAQAGPQRGSVVVTDRDRSAVHTYYRNEFATGNCPPGLAKKNNGCLPPGQAKKLWNVGQPLPPTLVFYPLPAGLLSTLTPPPPGYQYVRVDDDVLLMITATRIITSLVTNLGG